MSAILIQKSTPVNFGASPYSHRRHPSAPVVVQPTHTPGIFSIKPHKPTPNRQLVAAQRQSPRASPRPAKAAPVVVRAQTLTPAPEIHDKQPTLPSTPSPSPQSRGRSQAKNAKEKAQTYRSASHSTVRGKHARQLSPPQVQLHKTAPSQAEVTVISPVKSSNPFDPFLDNPSASLISPPPSPMLARPSGKLARRRQQQPTAPISIPSKAIPVPNARRSHNNFARSAPLPSHMNQLPRPIPKRSSTYQDFPICDDMTEVADSPLFPPATPSRPSHVHGGLRSAPISAHNPGAFPFFDLTTPPRFPERKPAGRRNHQRVPSGGVFDLSDEEVSSSSTGSTLNHNVQALFGLATKAPVTPVQQHAPRTRDASPSYGSLTREQQLEREANEKIGYFASSMFQNSPSPEELPDPLLL